MRNRIVDFHAHAFPDELAAKAMALLEKEGGIKAALDGRVSSLLASMDRAGIDTSVVCSIATRPSQFEPILRWSAQVRSERIVPFPSVHPADPAAPDRVSEIAREGFKGVKLHPYYQDFVLDEDRLMPVYERVCREGLLLVVHTGYDFAFPFDERGGPPRILAVLERFPDLRFVATHLGAWKRWDQVEEMMLGKGILMELSFSLEFLDGETARRIMERHPADRLLFGTDSPWTDQSETLRLVRRLGLDQARERALLGGNAAALLGL